MTAILEYLRRQSMPISAGNIAADLNLRLGHVEAVLNDLKREGKASQLNSGRWEATLLMPTGRPKDERRAARTPRPRQR
jgi:DNA-binding IclR family transcriptional regulator